MIRTTAQCVCVCVCVCADAVKSSLDSSSPGANLGNAEIDSSRDSKEIDVNSVEMVADNKEETAEEEKEKEEELRVEEETITSTGVWRSRNDSVDDKEAGPNDSEKDEVVQESVCESDTSCHVQEEEIVEVVSTDPAAKPQSYLPQAQSVEDALSFQLEEMNPESIEKSLGAVACMTDKPTQVMEEEEEDEDDDVDGNGLEFKPGRTYRKLCRQLLNVRVWTVCYILLLLYHTLCSQQLYDRMVSNLADSGAILLKQEDDIAARMLQLRGRVPTTDELVAMVQENKKATVEEVSLWHIRSIQLVPVDTDGTVLLISM